MIHNRSKKCFKDGAFLKSKCTLEKGGVGGSFLKMFCHSQRANSTYYVPSKSIEKNYMCFKYRYFIHTNKK